MKATFAFLTTLLITSPAFAGPDCTKEPKDKWKDQNEFQESLKKEGYKIKKFIVTKGNCYEIYGWNKEGKRVEIYFNPVTGEAVKTNID